MTQLLRSRCSIPVLFRWQNTLRGLLLLLSVIVPSAFSVRAQAAETGVLAQCLAFSGLDDDVHACMDNYLDVMDDRIGDVTAFIEREFKGVPGAAFLTAQGAFETYRRENCLWYLSFSTPRREAELIAKDCLARMSIDRLAELQSLLARGNERSRAIDGVDELPSDSPPVSAVAAEASSDSQAPTVEERVAAAAPAPGSTLEPLPPPEKFNPVAAVAPEPADPPEALQPAPVSAAADVDVGESVIAYFGAWMVDCSDGAGAPRCRLAVDFDRTAEAGDALGTATLALQRHGNGRTDVMLSLPAGAARSVGDLQWTVGGYSFVISGSELYIGASGLEQHITEQRFVQEDLLPLLRRGATLYVESRDARQDMAATLIGLTRALGFADDYLGGND